MRPMPTLPVLAAMALACGFAWARPIALRITAQESIPPKWVEAGHRITGVCPDILAAIEKIEPRVRFNRVSELRSIPFVEQGLAHGTIDAACALLDTDHRRKIAQVVGPPLYVVRHRLAARHDDPVVIDNMAALIALKPLINTQRSASYAAQLRALGLQVDDSSGDNTVNLKKIIAGHGRFFYISELTLVWLMDQQQFRGKVRMLDWVIKEEPIYFHISRKAPPASVKLISRALDRLQANGELARIYASWARGAGQKKRG
jgi:polar amino acid transport system substrate-binding protein